MTWAERYAAFVRIALTEPRDYRCGRYGLLMRRAIPFALTFLAVLVGTASAATVSPSGIGGTVIKSPTFPVCREDVPCSAPAAGVAIVFIRNGVRVATTTTSKAGTYRVVLRPGTYVVRSPRKLIFSTLAPRTVRVIAARFAVANFEIDTGIR